MEYQIGPDRPQKTELEKLELEESVLLAHKNRSVIAVSLASNLGALLAFLAWISLLTASYNGAVLLIPEVIGLLISIFLFIVFLKYHVENPKLKREFFITFIQYIVLIVFSILRI